MGEEYPARFQIEKPSRFQSLFRLKGIKKLELVWIAMAGLFGLGLLVYLAMMARNINKTVIHFNPADIVYGKPVHASHERMMAGISNITNSLPMDSSNRPEIQVSEQFYDFGKVDSAQVLSHTFAIANLGQTPLVILHAYTTCGCTAADLTSASIPPGKVALMTMDFDPGYQDMHGTTVRRGVMLETNDPEQPLQEIWIQATVK
jgi:hypothetical protein